MTEEAPRPASLELLVVEDEPHIRRILVTILESSGWKVTVALDGRAALDHLERDVPCHLVLMDLLMPGLSGLDVLRELRRLPHRSEVPVIILTAKGQDADRERAFELGASDFVTKPFSPKKLLKRVDQLLASV